MTDEAPVTADIYYVKVWHKVPGSNETWTIEIDEKTSAYSPLGAMKGIIDTKTAQEMLSNKKAVDEA